MSKGKTRTFIITILLYFTNEIQEQKNRRNLHKLYIIVSMVYEILQFCVIFIFSLICSVQDIKHRNFPFFVIVLSYISAVAIHLLFAPEIFFHRLSSALLFGLFYLIIKIITKNQIGLGDILFAVFQGFFLKIQFLPLTVILSIIFALLFYFIFVQRNKQKQIPFIPCMSLSLIITFFIS